MREKASTELFGHVGEISIWELLVQHMDPIYACGTPCREQDWVSMDGRIGYIQGDDWRMCMGTGFELTEDPEMWVAYPMFRDEDGVWHHEVVPVHHLSFVCRHPLSTHAGSLQGHEITSEALAGSVEYQQDG